MPSATERNKRLDALERAAKAWASKRSSELKDRVTFNKKILQGRTGAERLARANVSAVSELLVEEIDQFLTG